MQLGISQICARCQCLSGLYSATRKENAALIWIFHLRNYRTTSLLVPTRTITDDGGGAQPASSHAWRFIANTAGNVAGASFDAEISAGRYVMITHKEAKGGCRDNKRSVVPKPGSICVENTEKRHVITCTDCTRMTSHTQRVRWPDVSNRKGDTHESSDVMMRHKRKAAAFACQSYIRLKSNTFARTLVWAFN